MDLRVFVLAAAAAAGLRALALTSPRVVRAPLERAREPKPAVVGRGGCTRAECDRRRRGRRAVTSKLDRGGRRGKRANREDGGEPEVHRHRRIRRDSLLDFLIGRRIAVPRLVLGDLRGEVRGEPRGDVLGDGAHGKAFNRRARVAAHGADVGDVHRPRRASRHARVEVVLVRERRERGNPRGDLAVHDAAVLVLLQTLEQHHRVFTRGAEIVGWLGRTVLLVIRGEVREPWNLRGDTHGTHFERGEAGGEREVLRRGRLLRIVALVLVGERG